MKRAPNSVTQFVALCMILILFMMAIVMYGTYQLRNLKSQIATIQATQVSKKDIANFPTKQELKVVQGTQGPVGAQGIQGVTGASGLTITGPMGPQGAKGDAGEKGDRGPAGRPGVSARPIEPCYVDDGRVTIGWRYTATVECQEIL